MATLLQAGLTDYVKYREIIKEFIAKNPQHRFYVVTGWVENEEQEHRMGSIEFGKLANMTVFDCDFLHYGIEKLAQSNIIAAIVDGEEVYKA